MKFFYYDYYVIAFLGLPKNPNSGNPTVSVII